MRGFCLWQASPVIVDNTQILTTHTAIQHSR